MSSFLSGIGRALRAPGFGDRLQAALAAAGGDTGAIPRLRALQLQQALLQRQNDARDAQVIGAKNMGFSNDEIGAMNEQDLSWAARQRIADRMFGDEGAPGGEGDGGGAPPADAASQPAPGFAPPPGAPPPRAVFTSASLGPPRAPGFTESAASAGGIPRAHSHAQAASLPRGAFFFAPDGSIRRNM
jgi:hypothetical protein